MTKELALVDSNLIVYAFDVSERSKHKTAKKLLGKCFKNQCRYAVSIQNLSEFFYAATNKIENPLSPEKASKIVNTMAFFKGFMKIAPDLNSVLLATSFSKILKTHYWDCLLAATMLQNKIMKIYTENTKDFSRIPDIAAENPLE